MFSTARDHAATSVHELDETVQSDVAREQSHERVVRLDWHVYALRDPNTGRVRYVGRSKNPARRLSIHVRRGASQLKKWCASLGGSPLLEVVESFETETDALLGEQRWIATMLARGEELLNATPGGEVGPGKRRLRHEGFGRRLRQRRTELKLRITTLARMAEIDRRSIYRMEGGATPGLSADCAVDLARALGVTVEWLVTGEEVAIRKRTAA